MQKASAIKLPRVTKILFIIVSIIIQSVQSAIDTQLSFLARTQPRRKVCLVTFSTDVNVIGDSIIQPVVVAGDRLHNVDYLVDTAKDIRIPAPIKNTQKALSRSVYQ